MIHKATISDFWKVTAHIREGNQNLKNDLYGGELPVFFPSLISGLRLENSSITETYSEHEHKKLQDLLATG